MALKNFLFGASRNPIIDKFNKQKKEYEYLEDYYEGEHWAKSGVVTTSGVFAVDKEKTEKKYTGVVINIIKDNTDTMTDLVIGVDGIQTNIEDFEELNIELGNSLREVTTNLMIYDKAYVGLYLEDGVVKAEIIEPEYIVANDSFTDVYRIYCNEDDKVEYVIEYVKSIMVEGGWTVIGYDKNMEEFDRQETTFMPYFKWEMDEDYVENQIKLQDYVNIMATQEFEVNKYQGSPAFAFKNVSPVDAFGKKLNPSDLSVSESNILFLGEGGEALRIQGGSVTPEFRASYEYLVNCLYKVAKLNGLKNNDIGSVQSGYSIELKLMDTLAFVKKVRNVVKEGFKVMFKSLEDTLGLDEITLEFTDAISKNSNEKLDEMQKKIDMADKMKLLGVEPEFLWEFIGLDEEQIAKIKALKEANKTPETVQTIEQKQV